MGVVTLASVLPCSGQPIVQAVLNGASFGGNVAPGTWVAIFGSQLAPAPATATSVPLETKLNGVSVSFAGIAAPVFYVSPTQINAVIPFEVPVPPTSNQTVSVVVTTPAGVSAPLNIVLWRNSPGLFTQNGAGTGNALAFDANFQPVAAVGSGAIVLYADGLGPTSPPGSSSSGGASVEPFNRAVDGLSVFVGDVPATVIFAGLAPGFPGIYQLNVIPNGPVSDRVYLQVNGWQSNIASVPVIPGSNVANAAGTINALYPPPSQPVKYSALPIIGSFSVDLDILPGAQPFAIVATSEAGSAIVNVNPSAGTWQATLSEPPLLSRTGDFSQSNFKTFYLPCVNNSGPCMSAPGNVIPSSLMDPVAIQAMASLPRPNSCSETSQQFFGTGLPYCTNANATYSTSGTLPVGGHFSIGTNALSNLAAFAGFIQIAGAGPSTRTTTFRLYVDNRLIATKTVGYPIAP